MAGKGRRDGPRTGAPASRRRARGRRGRRRPPIEVLIILGGIVIGLGAWVVVGGGASAKHPEPRPDITGVTVVPASRYAGYARVADVYRRAAQVAPVLDGLYCYCQCAEHSGHRSLLTCFESDHAAGCDVCMSEAMIAHRMTMSGKDLNEIRNAIDELFGS